MSKDVRATRMLGILLFGPKLSPSLGGERVCYADQSQDIQVCGTGAKVFCGLIFIQNNLLRTFWQCGLSSSVRYVTT